MTKGREKAMTDEINEILRLKSALAQDGELPSGCAFLSDDILLAYPQADGDARYRYLDLSANFTNHPNDFMVRLYAGCILSTFVEFESAVAYAD